MSHVSWFILRLIKRKKYGPKKSNFQRRKRTESKRMSGAKIYGAKATVSFPFHNDEFISFYGSSPSLFLGGGDYRIRLLGSLISPLFFSECQQKCLWISIMGLSNAPWLSESVNGSPLLNKLFLITYEPSWDQLKQDVKTPKVPGTQAFTFWVSRDNKKKW